MEFTIGQTIQNDRTYTAAVLWCNQHGATIVNMGDGIYQIQCVAEPSLESLKSEKLQELLLATNQAETSGYITLENGIKVDGRRTDLENIRGLISLAHKGLVTFPISFRDYFNVQQSVTLADLQNMETRIEVRGIALYEQKWKLETQIKAAATADALKEIHVFSDWPGVDVTSNEGGEYVVS